MTKIKFAIAASMLAMSAASFAQTPVAPVLHNDMEAAKSACEKNPAACEQAKTRAVGAAKTAKADCAAHPEACQAGVAKAKEGVAAVKSKCQEDPTQCQEVRSNVQGRQANRMGRRAEAKTTAGQ